MVGAKEIYEEHHTDASRRGKSVLKKVRGDLFKKYIGKNKTIIDLGCRDGALTETFLEGNTVIGVDVDTFALKEVSERLGIETIFCDLHGSWEEIKVSSVDVVTAGEILEHLFFPKKIIKKVKNKLKKEGMFIGTVPNAFSLKNRFRYFFLKKQHTSLGDPTHINHFTVKELSLLLKEEFSEVEIIGIGKAGVFARIFPQIFAFDLFFIARV